MDKPRRSAGPLLFAIVLLLLPAVYIASYLALVKPGVRSPAGLIRSLQVKTENYRYGGKAAGWFFWPLEQIDRKLRPNAWSEIRITDSGEVEVLGIDFEWPAAANRPDALFNLCHRSPETHQFSTTPASNFIKDVESTGLTR